VHEYVCVNVRADGMHVPVYMHVCVRVHAPPLALGCFQLKLSGILEWAMWKSNIRPSGAAFNKTLLKLPGDIFEV